jgi:F-type H+-transporting ATPase subunit alpha
VEVQLVTGLKAVDSMFPIGRGQRELILGDRATGKTALAVDAMLNQRDNGVICIYAAIGQKVASVKRVTAPLAEHGLLEKSIVVSADAEDPPGLVYLAPYAAVAMGEYFMDRGRDVLVILDDLTRHARSYRELSLLLRRPPGREAYPGDIFFIHSRLLERSTRLAEEHGGGSLTALPVVETQAKNLSAYIPTNLISITDGQIVLDSDLFAKAIKPAVDAGESVSRVGGKTQLPALRAVAEEIRLEYAQFEELEVFTRFGATVEEETRRRIERGKRIREILKQPRLAPLTAAQQVLVFLAVDRHLIDDLPLDAVLPYTRALAEELPGEHREIMERIRSGEELGEEDWQALETACREAAERFRDGESAEAPRRRDEAAAPAPEEASRALARGGEDGEAEGGGKTADEPRD